MAAEQRPMRRENRPTRKLVVAIPTCDRPAYLHWTVKSVLEQAEKHGHENVEIVISDQSGPEKLAVNRELLGRLRRRFPKFPIHHYPTSEKAEPIEALKRIATKKERKAMRVLMPEDGHYGSHRNRLTLLALHHGGPEAAYLHIDDDLPIAQIEKIEANGRTRHTVKKRQDDVLGTIRSEFEETQRVGAPGTSFPWIGAKVCARSQARLPDDPHQLTHAMTQEKSTGEALRTDPSHILNAEAAAAPCPPFGIGEIGGKNQVILSIWSKKRVSAEYLTRVKQPIFAHVGVSGPARMEAAGHPMYAHKYFDRNDSARESYSAWLSLTRKAMGAKPETRINRIAAWIKRLRARK